MHFPLLLSTFLVLCLGYKAFDHSFYQGDVQKSSYECLRREGYSYGVIQAQRHLGLNPYFPDNFRRARAAGLPIDIYMFPDKRQDGTIQARTLVEWLKSENVLTNQTIFVDIEDTNRFLPTVEENVRFVHDIVNELNRLHKGCGRSSCVGIYASKVQWDNIMTGNTDFKDYPLWYPHYDMNPSFDDFVSFGGWNKDMVVMKQFKGTTNACKTQIDLNYYEKKWWM
ncbi:hypothetical protein P9112_000184 [Eukaryota sp. TZLM1-RC]